MNKTLDDFGFSDAFWISAPKTTETKAKANKWDYVKLKGLCTVREISLK